MPNGGKLSIDCENFEGQPEGLPFGKFVKIVVKDSGVGIAPEIQGKIFEPFFTTKPIGKGTGLGLPSVYGLVQRYNGNILLQSAPHKGTLFTLYFPVLPETSTQNRLSPNTAKCCYLDLSPEIEKLIRPLWVLAGWRICETPNDACVKVSHEATADICVPKTFMSNAHIQHPYALYQVWDAICSKSKLPIATR